MAKSDIPTCLWCGKKLPYFTSPKDQVRMKGWGHEPVPVERGYLGDGRFCTLRCGWRWANYMADDLASGGAEHLERWQSDNPYPNPDIQPKTGDDS